MIVSATVIAGYAAIVILVALFLLFVWITLKVHWVHKKYEHIPSVPRASFYSGHLKYINECVKRPSDSDRFLGVLFHEWYQKLGLVFCCHVFTVTVVIVLDPNGIKKIALNSNHPKSSFHYKVFTKVCGSRFAPHGLVAELDHEIWHKQRVILDVPFRRRYLKDFLTPFNVSANLFINKLRKKADGRTEIVLDDHINRCTLDVILKVAFSMDLGVVEHEDSYFNQAIGMALMGSRKAGVESITDLLWSSGRKFRKDVRNAIKIVRDTGREYINKRIEDMNSATKDVPEDILTFIIKAGLEVEGNDEEKMEVMIDQFLTFFIAGQETTAHHLSFTVIALCRHPEVLHRLKTEVDAILGNREFITYDDIIQMTYMMQVLKESLRLWPPAWATIRHLESTVEVMGYKIPADTMTLISFFGLGRVAEHFPNPDLFNPDRFSNKDDVKHYTHLPFSLGPRNCIGQHFAMIEARVILAKLIQTFSLDLVPEQDFRVLVEILLKPKDGCKVFLQPRTEFHQ